MESLTLPIYNIEGKEIEKLNLDPAVFDGKINQGVLYQAVLNYRACQRGGLASTKTRGEVSGGGRKPWRQKGTGRARVGSIRSPLWRGGGIVFGPHPRDFSYNLNQKIKLSALKSSLNAQLKGNNIILLNEINIGQAKTKEVVKILSNLKPKAGDLNKSVLLLSDKLEKSLRLASGNIAFLEIGLAKDANAYQVIKARKLIITKEGLKQLVARFKVKPEDKK
jgi:large subunit ribosomal protein L4